MKLDGIGIAEEIIDRLKKKETPDKILAAVLVGEDKRSESFLKRKEKTAKELGIDFKLFTLQETLGNDGLKDEIEKISDQDKVGGVIVQLPLPIGIDSEYILSSIPADKDIDVLNESSGGNVLPPSVGVVKEIIERQNIDLSNLRVVILGVGKLVGEPIRKWMEGRCEKLDIIDEFDSREPMTEADIIISGVGKAWLIDPAELKEGCGVIDFGYSYDGKLSGDLKTDDEAALNRLRFYTPTPGGTGPILVAKLFENFYSLCGRL